MPTCRRSLSGGWDRGGTRRCGPLGSRQRLEGPQSLWAGGGSRNRTVLVGSACAHVHSCPSRRGVGASEAGARGSGAGHLPLTASELNHTRVQPSRLSWASHGPHACFRPFLPRTGLWSGFSRGSARVLSAAPAAPAATPAAGDGHLRDTLAGGGGRDRSHGSRGRHLRLRVQVLSTCRPPVPWLSCPAGFLLIPSCLCVPAWRVLSFADAWVQISDAGGSHALQEESLPDWGFRANQV